VANFFVDRQVIVPGHTGTSRRRSYVVISLDRKPLTMHERSAAVGAAVSAAKSHIANRCGDW